MPNSSAAAAEPSPLAAKLMQKPPLSLDRLPVLRTTLANAAKGCQEATRPYASAPAEISLAKLESADSTAVVEAARDNLCSIFRANAWDSRVLVTIDRAWLDAVVEAAYGGDGTCHGDRVGLGRRLHEPRRRGAARRFRTRGCD